MPPGQLCPGGILEWPPSGRFNNPQLDLDHRADLPGPENINVVATSPGGTFDVGVHYFGCDSCAPNQPEETRVVVRLYCFGSLMFESEAEWLSQGSGSPRDASGHNLWLVGRVTSGVGMCNFVRCGSPGSLDACIIAERDW